MDSEVVKSKIKSENKQKEEKKIKTLKFRIFPSEKEKEDIHLMFDQFRWYYNSSLTIFYLHYGYDKILNKNKYSNTTFRDILRKYRYEENTIGNLTFKDFVYDKDRNELMIPEWWNNNVHSRLPRGAVNKFISSINSAITNYKNKNINKFQMHFISKKSNTQYLHFEDSNYPSVFKHIKSTFWYRTKSRKRKFISLKDVTCQKRGIEIIYEKDTNKYFLHYPVDIGWFPDDDIRNDNQVKFTNLEEPKIISLDPGVRKFLVGYDPDGQSIFIGDGASKELSELLYTVDKIENKRDRLLLWRKIKNLVNELHWKTVSFLIKNYDIILLPDFRTSEMVKKKKISRMTKRLMLMFSFHRFKQKLSWKCNVHNKKLIIVDESFTSCTCTNCGIINNTKGKENLKCIKCNLEIDRDVAGSRNILIKTLKKINIKEVV
jgi:putative transposase